MGRLQAPPPPPLRTPPPTDIAMASSGDGHGVGDVQRYIDPDHVHSLFMNFEFQVLIDYVDSFPGAAGDELCDIIKKIVQAFLERALIQRMELLQIHQLLGAEARSLAQNCRFLADGTNAFV